MIARIFNAAGDLVLYVQGPPEQVEVNVPPGGRFEEVVGLHELNSLPVIAGRDPPTEPAP